MSTSSDNVDCLIDRAKKAYIKNRARAAEELLADISRLRYIKRLINRRLRGSAINDRLLLNHVIIWFNSFDTRAGLELLLSEMEPECLPVLLAYTDYLSLTANKAPAIDRCGFTVDQLKRM